MIFKIIWNTFKKIRTCWLFYSTTNSKTD